MSLQVISLISDSATKMALLNEASDLVWDAESPPRFVISLLRKSTG